MANAFQTRGTKPYLCDICGEHRDAHESPPTTGATPDLLVCEDCSGEEPTVPASRIMRERDEHKAAWAREYTRANTLDAALDRARQATDDWRQIALQNGEELAKARVQIARMELDAADAQRRAEMNEAALTNDAAEWRRRSQANFARADKLAEWIAQQVIDCDYTAEDMRELLEAAGVECRECDGRGVIDDEVMLGDPGDKHGYTTRAVRDECEKCGGVGRCIR